MSGIIVGMIGMETRAWFAGAIDGPDTESVDVKDM